MRYADSFARTQSCRYVQQYLHRYRWRTVHRRWPEYLFFAPDQHENHDEKLQWTQPHSDRRVRRRYGTTDRRSHRRSCAETFQSERNVRSNNDSLSESEAFCRRSWRSSQRCHALRPPLDAGTLSTTDRKSGQFICRRDCPENRIAGRCNCRCFGNCRKRIHQCR